MSQVTDVYKLVASLDERNFGNITGALASTDWTDQIFTDTYWKPNKGRLCKPGSLEQNKITALRYLAFYTGQIALDKEDIIKLYFSILPLMTINGTPILDQSCHTKDPYFPQPPKIVKNVVFCNKKQGVKAGDPQRRYTLKTSDGETAANQIIHAIKSNKEKYIQEAINMVCFMAFSTLRLPKKETGSFSDHMTGPAHESFNRLYSPSLNLNMIPPHQDFISSFMRSIHLSDSDLKCMYAHLVHAWIKHTEDDNKLAIGVLNATCMLVLYKNGLGLLSWPLKAAAHFRVEIEVFLKRCLYSAPLKSQIAKFNRFFDEKSSSKTWFWCKLFNESALNDYSTKSNPDLCIICALLTVEDTSIITGMLQFSSVKHLIKEQIPFARRISSELGVQETAKAKKRD